MDNNSQDHPFSDRLKELETLIAQFVQDRDWEQFHNAKDLSIALSVESAELLEAFLWKRPQDADPQKIKEELADVFCYAIMLARHCHLDIEEIIRAKMKANAAKYPVDKARGNAKKYTEF